MKLNIIGECTEKVIRAEAHLFFQATILRCLNHPSIVSLVAVGIRPSVIVLELAPMGTLGALVKKDKLESRLLLQRIALQVSQCYSHLVLRDKTVLLLVRTAK